MTKRQVQEAYDRIRPTQEEKDAVLRNILSAASASPSSGKDTVMKNRIKKPLLIAAVVALMVMLMGCAILALNFQDLKVGEFTYTYPKYIDASGETVYAPEIKRDMISLQGMAGTPEFLAAQEWEAYEWDMIDNHSDEILNDFRAPADYDAFLVGNQQMQDKIDEICAKYDLMLPGPIAVCQQYDVNIFLDALGLDGLIQYGAEVLVDDGSGYFYANGNFKQEFLMTLTGEEAQWPHQILLSYSLKYKGYLDGVAASVEDVSAVQQWNYTLSDGTEILIVKADGAARIFCDREDAFLSVFFDTTYDNEVMSDRDIELVAEALDFTVKPEKPDMEAAMRALAESEAEYQAEQEALWETYVDPHVQDSYKDYILNLMDHSPEEWTYGFADLNNDGMEELLIGYASFSNAGFENCFAETVIMRDGQTGWYITTSMPTYFCEGFVLECLDDTRSNWRSYYVLDPETGEYDLQCYLHFNEEDQVWVYGTPDDVWPYEISEEEAHAIMDSYIRITTVMRPITEYPMEE